MPKANKPSAAPAASKPEAEKKPCAISREKFHSDAKPLLLQIGESAKDVLGVKDFSSGSFGWYGGGKVVIEVGGVPLKCQLSVNLTVVNSKETKA